MGWGARMPDVLFCRTRYHYQSYTDYFRLVELAGYPIIFVDELDPQSDHTYIISPMNGEWKAGWPGATARIIWWQLEWEGEPDPLPPGVSEKWTSDRWHAQHIGAKYVPFGSDERLADTPIQRNGQLAYDVAWFAYADPPRRAWFLDRIVERGLTVAPNGWGEDRHRLLQHSKAMVYVHQQEGFKVVAPQRFALAAAYRLPLITETLYDWGIFRHGHLLQSQYDYLPEFVQMWTHRNEARILEDYGWNLHHLLCCEYPFRKCVEAAL